METFDLHKRGMPGKVVRFQDTLALIELSNGKIIEWPIQHLPDACEKGSVVLLKIVTEGSERAERENLAKALLNQILEAREG